MASRGSAGRSRESVPSNMRQSRGIWHWRCVIPADLRAHYGKRELVRSTKTSDRLRAQAPLWTIEARDEFARLRRERDAT